jgi:hypothetical protein
METEGWDKPSDGAAHSGAPVLPLDNAGLPQVGQTHTCRGMPGLGVRPKQIPRNAPNSNGGVVMPTYEERLAAFVQGKRLPRRVPPIRNRAVALWDVCASLGPRAMVT